jgi:nucleoside-diphosphate-sugar epimerase
MKILVTGGAGYLGAVLLPKLLARGHKLRVIDVGYFGLGHLRAIQPSIELVREDIRRANADAEFRKTLFDGCDAVLHLAALSNDPSADLNPGLTEEVNTVTTRTLAEAARERGVRFVFSSSCSVYGGADGEMDENGVIGPLTTYAVSKAKAEKALFDLETAKWKPVILRNGTLFGYSPKMRFDLVVNIFSLYSVLRNEIKVFGGGSHWRPFVHVNDCARAFVFFAEKPALKYSCYNVAHENLRVLDVAAIFRGLNPRLNVVQVPADEKDQRDYRTSVARLREEGFRSRTGVEEGAEGIMEAIVNGSIPDPESVYYQNAKWLKELNANPPAGKAPFA